MLIMALFLSKAITEKQLNVASDGYIWRIRVPDTDLCWAVWYGFIAGKKLGYMIGPVPEGTKWVSSLEKLSP